MRSLIGVLLLALGACDAGSQGDTQKADASQGAQPAAAGAAKSQVGKVDRSNAGKPAPEAAFVDKAGKTFRIADFQGKPVLVNLWATWCAPCLAEMPALDRLAAREAEGLVVLPISQDLEGWKAVDGFFTPGKFKALTPYLDQPNELALAVGAKGLPISIMYDADGKEVWRVNGPLEWDQPEVAVLLPAAAATAAPAPARSDPWAEAKARGIDFRALGTEPGWYAELDAGKSMDLVLDYGELKLSIPAPKSWKPGSAGNYAVAAKGRSISISVMPGTCNDGMSDATYPAHVTVSVDSKTYKGCGRYL